MGQRQAYRSSVMFWAMKCQGTSISRSSNSLKHCCRPCMLLWKRCSLMAVVSFSGIMLPAAKQKRFRSGLRSTRTCLTLRFPQISIPASICGICWTRWRPHLTTYRTSGVQWSPCLVESGLFCQQKVLLTQYYSAGHDVISKQFVFRSSESWTLAPPSGNSL